MLIAWSHFTHRWKDAIYKLIADGLLSRGNYLYRVVLSHESKPIAARWHDGNSIDRIDPKIKFGFTATNYHRGSSFSFYKWLILMITHADENAQPNQLIKLAIISFVVSPFVVVVAREILIASTIFLNIARCWLIVSVSVHVKSLNWHLLAIIVTMFTDIASQDNLFSAARRRACTTWRFL